MADLRLARAAIQRAYTKLINRFGPESEVIEALNEALNYLKEPRVEVAGEPAETETVSTEAEDLAAAPKEPAPSRRGRPRRY